MMQKEAPENDLLMSSRAIWVRFDPPLPEGSTWELSSEDGWISEGKVDESQRTKLVVKTVCTEGAKLELRVFVPSLGQCRVQEYEGGLVIIDTLDIACSKPRPQRRQSAKPKKEFC
jgi:hypothetical protein